MANVYEFNGTTVAFDGNSMTELQSCTIEHTVAEVPVTGADDSGHTYQPGIPDRTVTVDVLGELGTPVFKGDTGALVVTWAGTEAWGGISSAIVTNISKSGTLDGQIVQTITFRPA